MNTKQITIKYPYENTISVIYDVIIIRDSIEGAVRKVFYMRPNDSRPDDLKEIDALPDNIIIQDYNKNAGISYVSRGLFVPSAYEDIEKETK